MSSNSTMEDGDVSRKRFTGKAELDHHRCFSSHFSTAATVSLSIAVGPASVAN